MTSEHVWAGFANGLEGIYSQYLKDGDLQSDEMAKLIRQVSPYVVEAASIVLNKYPYAKSDPDDVAQEWWASMNELGFKNYTPDKGSLTGYAFTVLKHICSGLNRKGNLRQTKPIPFEEQVRDWEPIGLLCKLECDIALRKALRGLPKKYRRAFILRYILGTSSAEGARRCGLHSVNTFNTWLFEARNKFRRQLAHRDWLMDSPIKRTWRKARNYFEKGDRCNPHPKEQRHDKRND